MDVNYIDAGSGGGTQVVVLRMTHMFIISYSYLVIDYNSKQSIIVDPAWNIEKVEEALFKTQSSLSGILLTHSHPDHVHLAQPLADKYNCPIWMSNKEISFSGFSEQQLIGIDMTPWFVGQIRIQPILTPGHTPGSTCYLVGNNLFSGDTLFAEGCGLCPDMEAAHNMYNSLNQLRSYLTLDTRIFPGHVYDKPPGQKFSELLKCNIYLQFKNVNDFVAYRMRPVQNKLSLFDFR
ncbi:MBL fold metallo-hydrolase [Sporocytophaga myxococcoides]|uniref:MBL fold metallo-hydrolase n=1 Tax=Sporocytophaga myxococcoides TaxID=153721 RepID=UPI0004217454|nr:MBL fold metallo-hydrolase [Sporocytophaga myxococcoides]